MDHVVSLCLTTSGTRTVTFLITRRHIPSVLSQHMSTIRALSSMDDAVFLVNGRYSKATKKKLHMLMSGLLHGVSSPHPWQFG